MSKKTATVQPTNKDNNSQNEADDSLGQKHNIKSVYCDRDLNN